MGAIFVGILVFCCTVLACCVFYLGKELDNRTDELRLLERLKDNEEGRTRSWERSAISAIKERDELKKENEELKLILYMNISSYYKRNGGVEDE